MKQFSIGDLVSRAWDLAVKNWPIFVLLTFVSSMVEGLGFNYDTDLLTGLGQNPDPQVLIEAIQESMSFNTPLIILGMLISLYLGFVAWRMYFNAIRTGRPYETMAEAFKVDINQLAVFFVVSIVFGLIVGFGTCLCILPGIFLGVRLCYAPLLAAQGATFSESFSRSWALTKGHFWNIFLMGLTMIGIYILGFCACCVGIYFAQVIVYFMLALSLCFFQNSNDASTTDATYCRSC